uniref:SDR family NAD(P)-dependent oxidoreductase n=1 Tax=Jeotgalibaca porci TaxID=1868793 RepID=UPI0035A1B230
MDLTGKTVIVTGSSRGIGEAIAEAFAKQGANIVLNARKAIPEEMVSKLEGYGVKVETILGDVSDFESAKHLIERAKELLGSVDVLVNNT